MEKLKGKNKEILYFCAYVPSEIIHGAGYTPIRFFPSPSYFEKTDEFIPKYLCPYLRCITEEVLEKEEKVSKAVFTDGCDSSKRIYEVWKELSISEHTYYLQVPFGEDEEDIKYYAYQLRNLFSSLGGEKEEKIFDSIELYNLGRRKIKNLTKEGMRGTSLFKTYLLFYTIPIEEFLEREISFDGKRDLPKFYLFSTMFPLELMELIESFNVEVSYDDSCFGVRTLEEVEILEDPFYSLSKYLLKREGCVRRRNMKEKVDIMIKRIKEEKIKGVIFYSLKYCDPLLFFIPLIREKLREENIPTLLIEDDFTLGIKGQIRTRVEAFLEMTL